jgi:hypothetical protein
MKDVLLFVKNLALCAGLLFVLGSGRPLLASDFTGIYALVEKVVLEPTQQSPERIQIWGVFILSKGKFGSEYEPPIRGYLYFSLPKEKQELAKTEWADLKKIAGTGQCVAFGSRYELEEARPKVRGKQDKPERPDRYPLGIGLTKIRDDHYQIRPLKSLPPPRP